MATSSRTKPTLDRAAFGSFTKYLQVLAGGTSLPVRCITPREYAAVVELVAHGTDDGAAREQAAAALADRLRDEGGRERRVYLASPCGFLEWGAGYRREIRSRLEALGMDVLDPWDLEDPTDPVAAGARNVAAIERCGRVVAVLDGPDVDSGVAAEIAYAYALGRRVDGIRSDLRAAGEDPRVKVNLQVQWFVAASGGKIMSGIRDLAMLSWSDLESDA